MVAISFISNYKDFDIFPYIIVCCDKDELEPEVKFSISIGWLFWEINIDSLK